MPILDSLPHCWFRVHRVLHQKFTLFFPILAAIFFYTYEMMNDIFKANRDHFSLSQTLISSVTAELVPLVNLL